MTPVLTACATDLRDDLVVITGEGCIDSPSDGGDVTVTENHILWRHVADDDADIIRVT